MVYCKLKIPFKYKVMTQEKKVYCPYSALDLGWETLKNLQNITFKEPWYLKRINYETKR